MGSRPHSQRNRIAPGKSASEVESTKIPLDPVRARSDHGPRCESAVYIPGIARLFAQRHVPVGIESAPAHAANSCRQIGAQEPAIGSLIRRPSDCREP
jgi:hypothetical protein